MQLLDAEDVAAMLKLRKSTIYKLTHRREIPFLKIRGGALRFRESDIQAWLVDQEVVMHESSRINSRRDRSS